MTATEIFDLTEASSEQIAALQQKSLSILLYFKQFCEEHKLLFFLCGGCCIGAVRHGGFIPWDDDIDVFMPREDYEKLCSLWNEYADTKHYSLSRSDRIHNYHHTDTAIQDNYTTFINAHSVNEDINQGLMIDVIPLDGCPSGAMARKMQKLYAMCYSLFNAQRLPDHQGAGIRTASRIILGIFRSKNIRYSIWKHCERKMTKYPISECEYITELVTGMKYLKNEYPKAYFDHAVYLDFDGHSLPVPAGYDGYLKMAFGDYMSLPPETERRPKHKTIYINLNEGYKKYRGIYYLLPQNDTKAGKTK